LRREHDPRRMSFHKGGEKRGDNRYFSGMDSRHQRSDRAKAGSGQKKIVPGAEATRSLSATIILSFGRSAYMRSGFGIAENALGGAGGDVGRWHAMGVDQIGVIRKKHVEAWNTFRGAPGKWRTEEVDGRSRVPNGNNSSRKKQRD